MRALTLTQPWATLSVAPLLVTARGADYCVASGRPPKRHETRGWKVGQAQLPLRIAIHAGKGDAGLRGGLVDSCGRFVDRYAWPLHACGYETIDPWARAKGKVVPDLLNAARPRGSVKPVPLGAIVGVVTVRAIVRTSDWRSLIIDEETDLLDQRLGDWSPGRWAWRMENAIALEEPIPCRGYQQLWELPADVAAAVSLQLTEARA
jgi:hypothetical protein